MQKELITVETHKVERYSYIANDGTKFDDLCDCIKHDCEYIISDAVKNGHLIDLKFCALPYLDDYDITQNYCYEWYKVVDEQGYMALNSWFEIAHMANTYEQEDGDEERWRNYFPIETPTDSPEHIICLEYRYDDYDYICGHRLSETISNISNALALLGYDCKVTKEA